MLQNRWIKLIFILTIGAHQACTTEELVLLPVPLPERECDIVIPAGITASEVANPSPFDEDHNAIDDGLLAWDAAAGAGSYEIYMSTDKALVDAQDLGVLVSTQAGTCYDASAATDTYTTYYWRVVPVDAADPSIGFMPSHTWSFKQTIPASLGRGHRLLIKHGILLGTTVFPTSYGFDWNDSGSNITWSTYEDANYTVIDTHIARFDWLTGSTGPENMKYERWSEGKSDLLNGTGDAMLSEDELLYIGGAKNLVAFQAADEEDLGDESWLNAIQAAFYRWKVAYPYTLVHTDVNSIETHSSDSELKSFQKFAQPDLAFAGVYQMIGGGSLNDLYHGLNRFRDLGKYGIGSVDYAEPIPYGAYYQCFNYFARGDRPMGEPEESLAIYSAIAYGYKSLKGWSYSTAGLGDFSSELFSSPNDSVPTSTYYVMAENNRQIGLMGDTLVRLSNEGVYDYNDESTSIPNWESSSIPNITGISAPDDVVISEFSPLHEDFDGSNYSGQTYFFLLNGKVPWGDDGSTPADNAQTITLTIGGGITALEAIDISSGSNAGTVETIPVIDGIVDITLDGGRGKLFKFATGAPWVGFYNGE